MKVILLFALFGLSFYQASGNEDFPKSNVQISRFPYGDDPDSLAHAFHESAEFSSAVGEFICYYNDCKSGRNTKDYENKAKEFIYILARLGCRLEEIVGSGVSYDNVLNEISENPDKVGELMERVVGSLGIAEPVAEALCSVVGKVLKTECVRDALQNLAPSTVHDLTRFYCKDDVSTDEINEKVIEVMDKVDCLVDLVESSPGLAEFLRELGDKSTCVLGCILEATQKLPVVNTLLCTVFNGLLGEGGLLHGALDCLLEKGGILTNILKWK